MEDASITSRSECVQVTWCSSNIEGWSGSAWAVLGESLRVGEGVDPEKGVLASLPVEVLVSSTYTSKLLRACFWVVGFWFPLLGRCCGLSRVSQRARVFHVAQGSFGGRPGPVLGLLATVASPPRVGVCLRTPAMHQKPSHQ